MTGLDDYRRRESDRPWFVEPGTGRPKEPRRARRIPFAEAVDRLQAPRLLVPVEHRAPTDATHAVIAAVAYSIWQQRGGVAVENWIEAEQVVRRILVRPQSHGR